MMVERFVIVPSDLGPAQKPGLSSQVFGNGLELIDDGHRGFPGSVRRGIEAVVDVIMDQRALRLADGFFDGMKLLGEIKAAPSFIEHLDDSAEMTFGPLQPLDDFRVGFVDVLMYHVKKLSPPGG
jgi:hypothetical protein